MLLRWYRRIFIWIWEGKIGTKNKLMIGLKTSQKISFDLSLIWICAGLEHWQEMTRSGEEVVKYHKMLSNFSWYFCNQKFTVYVYLLLTPAYCCRWNKVLYRSVFCTTVSNLFFPTISESLHWLERWWAGYLEGEGCCWNN